MASSPNQEFPPPKAYRKAARTLERWMKACTLCPRKCGVNRLAGEKGFCRAGVKAPVNVAQLHFGEEPPISASRGSGTVFFAGCTMACVFCQNYEISQQDSWGEELDAEELALVFMRLKLSGAHNLNLVTPTPHLPVILKALAIGRENGLDLPVVYNTSGYERAATIRRLEGLIEIYMPDYKYADEGHAKKLSQAGDYVKNCRRALREMHRQVGNLKLEKGGAAWRGLLVRHLVLPMGFSGSPQVLQDLADICGPGVWVSLMSQYHPMYKAHGIEGLNRTLLAAEFKQATDALEEAGIENGFVQALASANGDYLPGFKM